MTLLIASCHFVTEQARRTSVLGYKLLLKIPVQPRNLHEQHLRESIQLLIRQTVFRKPHFSAAGFFDLDYSILVATFGSITSYTVVILNMGK